MSYPLPVVDDLPPPRRSRLWRFRRYEPPPPPDVLRDVGDAWLDGPPPAEEEYYPQAEDFLPSPPKPAGPLAKTPRLVSARPALLCFLTFWIASGVYWNDASRGGWASGAAVFAGGEWWRLFTALLTHSDTSHLLANTPLFLIFGWHLYAFFGVRVFPLAAVVVGVLSNAVTVYLYEPGARLVGASGMLYGMVALWLVLYVRFEARYTVPMRIFRAVGVSLLLLFPTTFEKQTSYLAHATGFVIGLGVGLALAPVVQVRQDP